MPRNEKIYFEKSDNINLDIHSEKKIENVELKKKIFGELFNTSNSNIKSGSFNTVIKIPDTTYLLRMMHWKHREYGMDLDSRNNSYQKCVKNELEGLKVQSEIYDECSDYTCNVYEYGKFQLKNAVNKSDKTIIKGVYAILEDCGVRLDDYIWGEHENLTPDVLIKEAKKTNFIMGCLQALKCLHEHCKYIHRDIKLDNIVIQEVNGKIQCKLIDFGLVTKIGENMNQDNAIKGTPYYLHPDSIDCRLNTNCKPFNSHIDIWALGMTLFFLVFGDVFKNTSRTKHLIKSGCNTIGISPLKHRDVCVWSYIPDLIKITEYLKMQIDIHNMNDINEFIYLLNIIFYQKKNIDDILECNYLKLNQDMRESFRPSQIDITDDENKALVWVNSNNIIEPNGPIKRDSDGVLYRSRLYGNPLILEKKSEALKQWRPRWFNFTIKNDGPYLLFYKALGKIETKHNYINEIEKLKKKKESHEEFKLSQVKVVNKKKNEISISNEQATHPGRSVDIVGKLKNWAGLDKTLRLRIYNMHIWIKFIKKFINRKIELYNLNTKEWKEYTINDCSFIKTCLHEDVNGNISWDNCNTSAVSGEHTGDVLEEVSGGGRKKTKKGNNKRRLKKTRRRKHKKRKRKTMYKKKLYTRKR